MNAQAQVRITAKIPTDENSNRLSRLREILTAQFSALDAALQFTKILTTPGTNVPFAADDFSSFDNLDDDVLELVPDESHDDNVVPVERRQLPLPSYQNFQDTHAAIELQLRQKQAERLLHSIRTTVADKSFQYTHVVRVAPRKSVKTRARAVIAKLNAKIAVYCCAYNRCRSAMLRLGAGHDIRVRFKVLSRAHVKASSAMIDPNVPGASSMQLSWIWQMQIHSSIPGFDSLLECEIKSICSLYPDVQVCSPTCSLAPGTGTEE